MLLDVRMLTPDDALPTFALARLYDPSLTLPDWTRQLTRPDTEEGTFAAFRGTTARALLRYMITRSADGAEVAVIRWVTAFDLIDPESVAEQLVAAVREREAADSRLTAWAPREGCGARFESAVAGEAVLHSVL
ncbi:hypothetical protein [Brevundimonas sp. FT23028]|uniref:hypothetical protein n=1 Tax=Brevundimonas sp. FT23028 TaxID=3393748 RepID=UPI003B585F90